MEIKMAYIQRSATNPALRKLYRQLKAIAKNSDVGDKVMCPCGCLKTFHKKTKNDKYLPNNGTLHKDRYNNRVRSKSNYDFDSQMLHMETTMKIYVEKNKDKLKKVCQSQLSPEKVSLEKISDSATSENLKAVMQQVKSLNKTSVKGSSVICPCGCGDVFCKTTPHHAFSRKSGEDCKDKYYEIVRSNKPVEMSIENVLSFKFLIASANKEIGLRKNKNISRKM